MKQLVGASIAALMLGACAGEVPVEVRIARADPAATVVAAAETTPVGTAAADAADDPAIWRNPADPTASLIVGTDKKAGLHVYGLDGRSRSFLDAGLVNNVDLREGVEVGGKPAILVAASDRNDPANARIALFTLDPATARLQALATVPAGAGEAYGICLARLEGALHAFLVVKDGTIRQFRLDLSGAPRAALVRSFKLATQSEGCAVDEVRARLYVGEEDRGLWRFDLGPEAAPQPVLVAAADGERLVADVEGVAVAPDGKGSGILLVSSQGDNAYVAFTLGDERFLGRVRVGPGKVGGTEETDGIDLVLGDFGAGFPGGLLVVQDGHNAPAAQNFKLIAWADIARALAIPR